MVRTGNETIREYSDYMESDLAPSQAWGRHQESSFSPDEIRRLPHTIEPEPKKTGGFWGKLIGQRRNSNSNQVADNSNNRKEKQQKQKINQVMEYKKKREEERKKLE